MHMLKGLLAVLLFISEIGFWAAIGRLVWLLVRPSAPVLAWVLAALSTGLVLLLWALFVAPKASRRLARLPRVALVLALTVGTGLGLLKFGDKIFGLLLLIPATGFQLLGQILFEDHL